MTARDEVVISVERIVEAAGAVAIKRVERVFNPASRLRKLSGASV